MRVVVSSMCKVRKHWALFPGTVFARAWRTLNPLREMVLRISARSPTLSCASITSSMSEGSLSSQRALTSFRGIFESEVQEGVWMVTLS